MHFSSSLRVSKLALAIAVVLTPAVTFAQTDASDAEDSEARKSRMPSIEVIRVHGERRAHSYDETGTVNLISRDQIERVQPLSNEDVLRRIAGINVKGEEESSIVTNFGIRGLSASESKSLVLEDGVPVAPGLFIGNDRYFNPRIQRVERVEILKGSSSLRYGPSTIGGVVNYQTKTPDEGVLLSSRVGSHNMRELNLEAGNHNAAGDAFAGVVFTHASSDGFMDKGYDLTDVMVKAGMALTGDQRVGLKFSYHQNDANISYRGLLLDDYRNGERYNPAPDDWYLQERIAFDVNHEWLINSAMTLNTLVYWSDVSRDYWRYNVDTAASNEAGRWVYTDALTGNNRSFERFGVETRLAYRHTLMDMDANSEFGLRFMTEESDDTRIRATRANDRTGVNDRHIQDSADSYAAYAQTQLRVSDRFAVTPGLRVESYEQVRTVLSDGNASAKTSNTEFLPGVGATFELTATAEMYGGVYRAFSPASNGVALDGLQDQQLDGERSTNYEIGVRGVYNRLSYEVAAFMMDFDNQVVTGNSDPNLSQSNAGKTEHYGVELQFGFELGGGFMLDSNATWIPKSEFMSGDNRGNRLPYAPEYLANLGLTYSFEGFSAAVMAHYQGEQFGDPSNRVDIPADAAGGIWGGLLPSYTVYDFFAQYQFNPSFTVFGSVKNLTDKQYIAGLRQGIYVGPERAFEIGFRYQF
ncbi:TonB-dependent receptor family protein [Aliidiomarina haloalkalitolerans]|uniref:TonB-dependent siderophore receptor n=1 Tax=Aliidiomarina haloalkalitolerans TaxID=859059 RepID=A0A432VYR7_9GAMM|nr:TonB-dependent receptor [Aliidiomarina haloalkalitolerans]RUO21802.1 TonB-dependent siderophore receptor [Aliidiomarina haloalkalitolerans]